MKEMKERTALGEAILKHWREHCPQMVRDLEKENRLDQAVFETQERTGDLLYELVSVKKMDYHAAWELAREEWALPQSEKESADLPPATNPSSGTAMSGKSMPGKSKSAKSRSATSHRRPRGRRRGTSG
jgi:thymidylate synthase ThyX